MGESKQHNISLVNTQIDRYHIKHFIAHGGSGSVYLAFDIHLNRHVALKILRHDVGTDEKQISHFIREARAAAMLTHPLIASLYSFGQSKGLYYMAMEYVSGKTLAELIKEKGCLDESRVLHIAVLIARALEFAHHIGIVHRDIKPANIMIVEDNTLKVLDFGLAHAPHLSTVVSSGDNRAGTPAYMSPEQCMGKPVDVRSDIYGLGITLYEMLTGRPPYEGNDALAVMYKVVHEPPPPIRSFNMEINPLLAQIVHTMIAYRPDLRYPDAATAGRALVAYRNGDTDMVRNIWTLQKERPSFGSYHISQFSHMSWLWKTGYRKQLIYRLVFLVVGFAILGWLALSIILSLVAPEIQMRSYMRDGMSRMRITDIHNPFAGRFLHDSEAAIASSLDELQERATRITEAQTLVKRLNDFKTKPATLLKQIEGRWRFLEGADFAPALGFIDEMTLQQNGGTFRGSFPSNHFWLMDRIGNKLNGNIGMIIGETWPIKVMLSPTGDSLTALQTQRLMQNVQIHGLLVATPTQLYLGLSTQPIDDFGDASEIMIAVKRRWPW